MSNKSKYGNTQQEIREYAYSMQSLWRVQSEAWTARIRYKED